jgi:hypothetical protein
VSRSGYSDDCDNLGLWRGAVASSIKGKRGQAFLKEALARLDAMPVKVLVSGELEADGQFCTLGVVGAGRGLDLGKIDTYDHSALTDIFNIAGPLAQEIMYLNDEAVSDNEWIEVEICGPIQPWEHHTKSVCVPDAVAGHKRWQYMRDWIASSIAAAPAVPA